MAGKAKKRPKNKTKNRTRRDSDGRVLRTGEIQLKTGTYRFKKTINGKTYTVNAPTLDQLRIEEEELLLQIADGIALDGNGVTVGTVFKSWFDTKRGISPKTREDYLDRYNNYIKESFGHRKIKSITKKELKQYYNQRFDDGLSFATIKATNQVFNQIFVEAIESKYIRTNPATGVLKELSKEPKSKQKQKEALTKEQREAFFTALKNHKNHHHYYSFCTLLAETGLRYGEAAGLQWGDIDFENGVISITHALGTLGGTTDGSGYQQYMHPPKTEDGNRIVPMSTKARQMLEIEKAKGIPCKVNIDGYNNFVFLNSKGGAYHYNTVNSALKAVVRDYNAATTDEEQKLPNITCHTFRHTFITRMMEDGVLPVVVQKIVGHASAKITLETYTHISDSAVIEAMRNREKVQNQKNEPNENFVPNHVPINAEPICNLNNIILFPTRCLEQNAIK